MSRRLPLGMLISTLVMAVVALSLSVALWLFIGQLRDTLVEAESNRMTDLARMIADRGSVHTALVATGSGSAITASSELQHDISGLRRALGIDFIVIMTPESIRLTHPVPERIGRHFKGGDEGPALAGEHYASRSLGTLGTSIRGFAPVRGVSDEVIGAVAVGVTLDSLLPSLQDNRRQVIVGVLLLMLVAAFCAVRLSRYIKRVLLGLEPYRIAQLVEEHQAMLTSVHEGILAVDAAGRITLANAAARRLFGRAGLGEPPVGEPLASYIPHSGMSEVLDSGVSVLDQELRIRGQVLLANRVPIIHDGEVIGVVATFRDKTEVDRLAEELTGARRYAEALRASTHEFKNKLHVIMGLVKLADLKALRGYLQELADDRLSGMALCPEQIRDPVLVGFLLGKGSEARERDVELIIRVDTPLPQPCEPAMRHTLIMVLGNLLENAFEAIAEVAERKVFLTLALGEGLLMLDVQDTGPGIAPELQTHVSERGVSTKGNGRGLGLALIRERLEASGGSFSLYSEEGRGTLIEIALPYPVEQDVEQEPWEA